MKDDTSRALLPASKVRLRYGVSFRTLDRWVADQALGFPRPVVISNRRYFRVADLEEFENQRKRAA
jgi:hypothetical protein